MMRGDSDWTFDGESMYKVSIDEGTLKNDLAPHYSALTEQALHVFGGYCYDSHLGHASVVLTGEVPFSTDDLHAFARKCGALDVRTTREGLKAAIGERSTWW